jgi:hypothetical protein
LEIYIAPDVGAEAKRVAAVHCPLCGGRILDVPLGMRVTSSEDALPSAPDCYIKCWRCKRRLGIVKTK